ncbi:MAG: hypothetical protein A2136_06605 [Chloroflexi bacterium RBG_16_54_11]|nr:MAG: hypothetical protein A2136_06605 [Chloroflexi bacterium RBG_16_54_11]
MEYPVLLSDVSVDNLPSIFFFTDESIFPVEFYAALVQDSMAKKVESLTTISEDFLITPGGKNYFRWEMNSSQAGKSVYSVMYFFEVGDWKLVITYARLINQGKENDALVESSIETIKFGP